MWPVTRTDHVVQYLNGWLLQFYDLLFYNVLKCPVIGKAWELPSTILVFVFPHFIG